MIDKFLNKVRNMSKAKLFLGIFLTFFVIFYIFFVAFQFANPRYLLGDEEISYSIFSMFKMMFTSPLPMILFLVFVCAGAIFFFQWILWKDRMDDGLDDDPRFTRAAQGTHGTAKLMTDRELKDSPDLSWIPYEETTGVILGKRDGIPVAQVRSPKADNYNACIFGRAGSNKTTGFIIPCIWQLIKAPTPESVITVDTKGGVYSACVRQAWLHGYTTKVFNVKDPESSQGIDVLGNVGLNDLMAGTVAEIIFSSGSSNADANYWGMAAKSLLKAVILAVGEEKLIVEKSLDFENTGVSYPVDPDLVGDPVHGYGTIGRMYDWLNDYEDSAFDDLCARFEQIYEIESVPHPSRQAWNTFRTNASDKVAPGIVQNALVALNPLTSDDVKRMLGSPDIDLVAPGKKKCLYFVNVDDQDTSRRMISAIFFTLMTQQLLKYADGTRSHKFDVPVNFVIDEFGSVGTIPGFNNTLSGARSRGLRCIICMQNMEQLKASYPDYWETILSNCGLILSYGCNDQTTAKYLSDSIGQTTIVSESYRINRRTLDQTRMKANYTETASHQGRMLFFPSEIMSIDNDNLLAFFSGSKDTLILEKARYWLSPDYSKYQREGWNEEDYGISDHLDNIKRLEAEFPNRDYAFRSNSQEKQNCEMNRIKRRSGISAPRGMSREKAQMLGLIDQDNLN